MFLQNKSGILFLAFSAFLILLMHGSLACAHIEKGQMPDPLAIMEYRILLEFEPDNLEVRNMLGMALYRQKKLDEAEQEFNYVLAIDPKNFDAIDALGLVKMKQGKLGHAVDLFKKAIYINPDDLLVHYHLGQTLELLGDADSAARAYRSALDKKPSGEQGEWYLEQQQQLIEALKNIAGKRKKSTVSR
jgi:Tfp pilus assembly protein PilF